MKCNLIAGLGLEQDEAVHVSHLNSAVGAGHRLTIDFHGHSIDHRPGEGAIVIGIHHRNGTGIALADLLLGILHLQPHIVLRQGKGSGAGGLIIGDLLNHMVIDVARIIVQIDAGDHIALLRGNGQSQLGSGQTHVLAATCGGIAAGDMDLSGIGILGGAVEDRCSIVVCTLAHIIHQSNNGGHRTPRHDEAALVIYQGQGAHRTVLVDQVSGGIAASLAGRQTDLHLVTRPGAGHVAAGSGGTVALLIQLHHGSHIGLIPGIAGKQSGSSIPRSTLVVVEQHAADIQVSAAAINKHHRGHGAFGVGAIAHLTMVVVAPTVDSTIVVVISTGAAAIGGGGNKHHIVNGSIGVLGVGITGHHLLGDPGGR